jgi:hypothetical protein
MTAQREVSLQPATRRAAAARFSVVAAALLFAVGLGVFVVLTVIITLERHVSPATVIFGPLPGQPLIVWLYWVTPGVLLQGGVALALRHHRAALRIAGMTGACLITALCGVWVGAMIWDLVNWLARGTVSGDLQDLAGEVFFGVPFGLAMGALNGAAAGLSVRDLRAHWGKTARTVSPNPRVCKHG